MLRIVLIGILLAVHSAIYCGKEDGDGDGDGKSRPAPEVAQENRAAPDITQLMKMLGITSYNSSAAEPVLSNSERGKIRLLRQYFERVRSGFFTSLAAARKNLT